MGALMLTGLYFGIVSWAESPEHALDLFWEDRRIVFPIIVGFGVQAALYTILKKRLFLPVAHPGPSGALTGAGGATSTLAMIACCAHHVTDVLPVLGLTAAAAFLAELATLTTDTGKTVQAVNWDAPLGGHHVEGTLSFPAMADNVSVLDGASTLILTIMDLDVPSRTFVWNR